MEKVPIRVIDFTNKADKARHDLVVKLVEQMLVLHRSLGSAKTPQEKTSLERQIAATDTQIDRLVYELYGLTEDEIKIVEGTTIDESADAAESDEAAVKPKRAPRKPPVYAATPAGPPQPGISPEQARVDAAHFYSLKEEPPKPA